MSNEGGGSMKHASIKIVCLIFMSEECSLTTPNPHGQIAKLACSYDLTQNEILHEI
jgi:hypothetical protein